MKLGCQDCKKRKAVIRYNDEPMFALTLGFNGVEICRQCCIKRMENAIKNLKKRIKEQKRLLK